MTAPAPRHFTKALFLHAWDLQDPGVERLMAWARTTGLDTLCLAAAYHSGWLVQPHHSSRRLRWSESGAVYFHPDEKLYHNTRLKPIVADIATENWFRLASKRAKEFDLKLVAWTVGAHNTRLGLAHPALAQQSAYGDILPHALSLGHQEVRAYLKGLCRDLAVNYSPYGIQLEGFQWHSVRHNHSHERDLTGLNDMERQLLSVCFNPETVDLAEQAGIDAGAARQIVRDTLETAFAHSPHRPAEHPQSLGELEQQHPELLQYNHFLRDLADSLIREIRQESLRSSDCKLYLQTGFNSAVADLCDGFAVWAYGQDAEQTFRTVRSGTNQLPRTWQGEFHCYIRLGMGIPSSLKELQSIIQAAREAGATGIYFYNYSEAPPTMLEWLAPALADQ